MGRYFSKRALKARMREPSTFAALAVLASVFGSTIGIPPDLTNVIVGLGAAAAGVLPESGSTD